MRGLLEGTTQEDIRTLAGYRTPAVHQSSSSREKAMESRKLSIKLLCLFPDEEEGTIAREKETKENLAKTEREIANYRRAARENITHGKRGTAASLSYVASRAYGRGRYDEAEQYWKRALVHHEKKKFPDYHEVAEILKNLGVLYHHQEQYALAEPLLKRSLAIKGKVLSPDHPDVAWSLDRLARLYRDTKRDKKAEKLENERSASILSSVDKMAINGEGFP
jgi:tetratricopeptide (TPR) repeat protein